MVAEPARFRRSDIIGWLRKDHDKTHGPHTSSACVMNPQRFNQPVSARMLT